MKKLLLVSLCCLAISACQDTRFVFGNAPVSKPSYSATMHYVFWGKKTTINPVAVCGSAENVAMIEEKEKTEQSWLRWLTGCIYQPVTVSVYCKRPVKTEYKAPQPK
ncbi:MAG: hypothetical protein IKS41_05280 [Alphaproteobacteria bacterium]|nr:hypothetical protein [Alphaproteobacteria bacterium]